MFLSTLLVDVGDNPDRPRPGRLWLRNVYRVHQRLAMAFPTCQRKARDPEMLKPYDPKDFGDGQVHVERDGQAGFLFRIDAQSGGRVVILVLSARKPDWNYAFGLVPGMVDPRLGHPIGNAGHLLAAPPSEPTPLRLPLTPGARLRFCLLANPTKKVHTLHPDSRRKEPLTHNGRRVPVATDELDAWLHERAGRCGFRVINVTALQPGYVYINKTRDGGQGQRLRSVRYEGILEVTDPAAFENTLAAGIGPAKGFGFGLLSVAPA